MNYLIKRTAVVGAGTMGVGIAAHLANAGFPVYLIDVAPQQLLPEEQGRGLALSDRVVRNRIANAGLERVKKASPPALFTKETAEQITVGNLVDDLSWLGEADWIVEAVIEDQEIKQALFAQIDELRKPFAIVSSNTSGLPIAVLAQGRSQAFRNHFLGTHFFNPPRYLKLLEVIPTDDTLDAVVAYIAGLGERRLGKGVVVCKDSPNFIANRLASVTSAYALSYAIDNDYSVSEVDGITGPLIGRPKTATFRLSDLVGLDVAAHVSRNLYPAIPHDDRREILRSPRLSRVIDSMLDMNRLGNKTGQGFYKAVKGEDGKQEYWELNLRTLEYEPQQTVRFESVGKARKIESLAERLKLLVNAEDRAGRYIWSTTSWTLAYAAHCIPEIADRITDADSAVRWGFMHELGPFETWDALGVIDTANRMVAEGISVPKWVDEMIDEGNETFYQYERGTPVAYYDLKTRRYEALERPANLILLKSLVEQGREIKRNFSASLIDLGDGVACLEFHSKMNALDPEIIEMANEALDEVERNFVGLVIGNQGEHFCVGANIFNVAVAAQQGAWDVLESGVKTMQDALMAFRFSQRPVVAAPFSMALGGGAEVSMAASRICAGSELYMGQVELAVGLIPAAGGCKELVRRVVSPGMKTQGASPLPLLQRVFEAIALARVSGSAMEARELGFLTAADRIVTNRDLLLAEAKRMVLEMAMADYFPPAQLRTIFAAGRDTLAALIIGIEQMQAGGFASEHDAKIARKLAYVLCGGDLSEGQWVTEQYILDLEREAFLSLLGEPKTIERIWHMLQAGKPLRN